MKYTELYDLISDKFDKCKELSVIDKMIARRLVAEALSELIEKHN